MNRDLQFLDAYTAAADGENRDGRPRRVAADTEQVQRLRQENNQLEAAVQLLAESVQALTLENERLRGELRRRHDLAPVDDSGHQPGDPAIRMPRR
jgi:predicted RNase H-like nuclease (RuvC/YqgF family)